MSFVGVCQIVCVSFFPFCIEGGMWDVIVVIPDHCLSIYFVVRLSKWDMNYIVLIPVHCLFVSHAEGGGI